MKYPGKFPPTAAPVGQSRPRAGTIASASVVLRSCKTCHRVLVWKAMLNLPTFLNDGLQAVPILEAKIHHHGSTTPVGIGHEALPRIRSWLDILLHGNGPYVKLRPAFVPFSTCMARTFTGVPVIIVIIIIIIIIIIRRKFRSQTSDNMYR